MTFVVAIFNHGSDGQAEDHPRLKLRRVKTVALPPDEWRRLSRLGATQPFPISPELLQEFDLRRRNSTHRYAALLASKPMAPIVHAEPRSALEGVFGRFHADHSFGVAPIDWGFRLGEAQATKALKHFLDKGPPHLRACRIKAFLTALGTDKLPNCSLLRRAVVHAEADRIDLEVHLPIENSRKLRPVIIEAKFGHRITEGQLSWYRQRRMSRDFDISRADYVIVGLTERAGKGLKGKQLNMWRLVTWRDLWLRFEKLRPRGDDLTCRCSSTLSGAASAVSHRKDTMPEFEIPESLRHYLGDKRVRAAVDALLIDAAGEKMPESIWSEAREYNDALLMALRTRRDLVDLHFCVWEGTFGQAGVQKIGEEHFEAHHNPAYIWDYREISCTMYRKTGGYQPGSSEEFYVTSADEMLGLEIYRWQADGIQLSPSLLSDVEGWEICSGADYEGAGNQSVPLLRFLEDPDPVIRRFREEAERAVAALLNERP